LPLYLFLWTLVFGFSLLPAGVGHRVSACALTGLLLLFFFFLMRKEAMFFFFFTRLGKWLVSTDLFAFFFFFFFF
jgi:hypothetical protein